ncbi:MAG: sugar kinase [Verrucomicrobiaceae bacterium]|nr:sugar kinase [Verrucomicrobiaceae bacterium]
MSRIVTFGEIMARLAAPGFKRFQQAMPGSLDVTFAGAEASIAASIAYLGGSAAFVTALPNHALADACVADLKSLGVDTRHIVRTDRGRLGLYFLETGANQRPGNVIYDREGSAAAVTPGGDYDWPVIFEGAEWFVISGITPAISRNAAEVSLTAVKEASARGVKVACDMNYRGKLWQWDPPIQPRDLATRTMRGLMPFVDLFIGGREDAAEMLGIPDAGASPDALVTTARQITSQFPRIQRVAMTRREGISATHNNFGGMLYDAAADSACFAPMKSGAPSFYGITDIVDRLGAGDAFTAALLFALTTPELGEQEATVSFATAAGCLAHSIEGDFNYVTRDEIESLMRGDASGRVKR